MAKTLTKKKKSKCVKYTKWGYIFLIPFFLTYMIFSFIPLISTIYNSFFENFMSGLKQVGPNFIGLDNYKQLIRDGSIVEYTKNTMIMWLMGFIPQIAISLLLAAWFTDIRLKLKAQGFFKTVIYMPNLIMASAFSMLFFSIFSDSGPVNQIMQNMGLIEEPVRFLSSTWTARGLVALMNFLMWFGNTTIILMAGMMGIDVGLFEAAQVDGAKPLQTFTKITIPLLKPILTYSLITSLIGGIQMFDVPQILTDGSGAPNSKTMTLIMYLNRHLYSKNYGMAGALSVMLFIITAILSCIVYKTLTSRKNN